MKRAIKKLISKYYQYFRIRLLYALSENKSNLIGFPIREQPVQFVGEGKITFGQNVVLGVRKAPFFYTGATYLEARNTESRIVFGNNISANNNFSVICDKTLIEIQDNVLVGHNVMIIDSDFHGIHPEERRTGEYACSPVIIEKNVFIGSQVIILKGVRIGENTIVASGSIVTKSFDKNLIIGGNPAKIISSIQMEKLNK